MEDSVELAQPRQSGAFYKSNPLMVEPVIPDQRIKLKHLTQRWYQTATRVGSPSRLWTPKSAHIVS